MEEGAVKTQFDSAVQVRASAASHTGGGLSAGLLLRTGLTVLTGRLSISAGTRDSSRGSNPNSGLRAQRRVLNILQLLSDVYLALLKHANLPSDEWVFVSLHKFPTLAPGDSEVGDGEGHFSSLRRRRLIRGRPGAGRRLGRIMGRRRAEEVFQEFIKYLSHGQKVDRSSLGWREGRFSPEEMEVKILNTCLPFQAPRPLCHPTKVFGLR